MEDNRLRECSLCPRNCGANRYTNKTGFCGQSDKVKLARAALHFWEEPCISGEKGSGAVFFSGCSLRCIYCQNYSIAAGNAGREISVERLARIFLELQEKGANNINLVTPGHFLPQIITALEDAKNKGLELPIVYNSSGYERVDSLKLLDGLVDIYLPDFKYIDPVLADRYSNAKDYPSVATAAVDEMLRQVGTPEFFGDDEDGIMKNGVIVRHLILPGELSHSKQVVQYLYDRYGDDIYISLMNQYTPVRKIDKYPELNRCLTASEYDEVVDYAIELGVERGFIQEGETAKESFIPAFDCEGV